MDQVVDAGLSAGVCEADLAALPLGELARSYPQALGLLRRLRLDYCCGGARTLREAAVERGLDPLQVRQQIEDLQPLASDAPQQPAELSDYIRRRFHDTHRAELPELARLAHKVERVHREHPRVPAGLGDLLERTLAELSEHMDKEENILFPMMQRVAPGMGLDAPIARMRAEHDDHAQLLAALRRLTDDGQAPADACNSWRALVAGVNKFGEELVQHIHLENNVLFPAFEASRRG